MKIRAILIFVFLFKCSLNWGQVDSTLSSLLDSLKVEDQKWRHLIHKVTIKETDSISIVSKGVRAVDSMNYLVIKPLFDKDGYPGYNKVGIKSSHNFWLLVQHADRHPDFQDSVLVRMKVEADKGNSSLQDYAYLLDRVLINTGQKQVYGTQMTLNSSKTSYECKPVIDPEKLNERRKQVGLSTLEVYIRIMNDNYLEKK
jgi:hypothetical protein